MEIHSSYEVRIEGIPNLTTRIADSNSLLESFINKLKTLVSGYYNVSNQRKLTKQPVVVGLDVEYNSVNSSKAAILQLCFGTHCVIIQLLHLDINHIRWSLNSFFADQNIVYVGVGIKNKLANLGSSYTLVCSKNVIELGSLADRVRRSSKLFDSQLEELAREIVRIEIKKHNSLNLRNWGARELTSEHIEYATLTAYASYALGTSC